jgi:polyferredoxin
MSETTELKESIVKLEKAQNKANSLSWNFYKGVIYGLGFFIGGTLLIGVIIYVLSFFDTAPIVGDYVSKILQFVSTTK